MVNIRFKNIEQYNDLQTRNRYYLALKESPEKAAAYLLHQQELSRDNSRTPMQWNNSVNAGFTTGKPWLPVHENYTSLNTIAQEKDPNSILNYFKKLSALRKSEPTLVYGKYTLLDEKNPNIFSYIRELNGKKILVMLNFTKNTAKVDTSISLAKAKLLLGNYAKTKISKTLRPYEAVIVKL
jgi:oligo-1,6-glucosidase